MTTLLDLASAVTQLKRAGRRFIGRCPFHDEKTPSFHVYPARKGWRFHCFGCGADGDLIGWIMLTRNVGYKEALRILGEEPPKPDPKLMAARREEERNERAWQTLRDRHWSFSDCEKQFFDL